MQASLQAVEKDIEQSALEPRDDCTSCFHGSVYLVNSGQKQPFGVSSHHEGFRKVRNA